MMTRQEKVRRDLLLIAALNADGALLTSEVRAVPCAPRHDRRNKKPASEPTGGDGRDEPSGGIPDLGRGRSVAPLGA